MKDTVALLKLVFDFLDQLTDDQIKSLLAKKAKLKIDPIETKKKPENYNIDEIVTKLESVESRVEAENYISSLTPSVDLLRQLSKHYSIPNASKMKSQDMIDKIIAATIGTKERHKALYETNL